jgi:hypothetical protein
MDKYKVCLVARGFTQIHGVNYHEMLAPVAKITSVCTILAITTQNNCEINAFDFHGAYLNGELDEGKDMYMEQPPEHETADRCIFILKLNKVLYGLKQGGCKWYNTLCCTLAKLGLKRAKTKYGVFYTHIRPDIILLAIHVNDCVLTGSKLALLTKFKQKISAIHKLTDMGPISWLLCIKVTCNRESRTLSLSQTSYIKSIVHHFNFNDLKPIFTPLDPTMQFSRNQCPQTIAEIMCKKNIPYCESIGSLMYAAIGTHPDITFMVSNLAQFQDNPGQVHWDAVKQIFCYLNGTKGLAPTYGGEGKKCGLQGFSDVDGASREHHHAITGFMFLVHGGTVYLNRKYNFTCPQMVSEICYFSLPFLGSEFHFSIFASKMFDDIHYFLSHFDQIYILNFGLLKCVLKSYKYCISGTHFNILTSQNIETADVTVVAATAVSMARGSTSRRLAAVWLTCLRIKALPWCADHPCSYCYPPP